MSEPIDAVADQLRQAGVLARRLREVLGLLAAGGARPLDELVRSTGVPRRDVELLLAAAQGDVEAAAGGFRLSERAASRYVERFALDGLDAPVGTGAQLELLRSFVASGPAPDAALDHVTATPETVLRRAEWLSAHYDLAGARVVCLGDHDLTSLAVKLLVPSASVTVVDVDERILQHLDRVSAEQGFELCTLHADLRFGLPAGVAESADVVITDPPYTPEGIGLFASRAVECLADGGGRVVIAYGFSPRTPALGHKVQQELLRLGLVFEAVLPGFNRYFGAQAIGSSSDLYVCQPTANARRTVLRQGTGIYTHGPHSVESARGEVSAELLAGVGERAGCRVESLRAPDWSRPVRGDRAGVFDLRADPGPWLLRMLLATNSPRAVFLVDNNHPDITGEAGQRALAELVADKYALRFHRSSPDRKHAVVVAEEREPGSAAGFVLRRAHGKLRNVWREALIEQAGGALSKREAVERVRARAPHPRDLSLRLIDLPRHRVRDVLRALGQVRL
ncbi:bis-aminopropyl spermidine synthase family protein [Saccharopolyspora rectivirgula]|nr:bis-aminopropyl spermidine synthase family protein [Saccharopolyspora rectivirgula]